MHVKPTRENLVELTCLNPFNRFPAGRIERLKRVTPEAADFQEWKRANNK
jgi:hypothetical protein